MRQTKIIGITGNIGTGKSTVAGMLKDLGAAHMDADKLGHEMLAPQGVAYDDIVATFGRGILKDNGEVDRSKLAAIVFNDPEKLKKLNQIMWPRMRGLARQKLDRMRQEGVKVVVLEAAVMFEAGWEPLVGEVWVTVVPQDTVIKRLLATGRYTEQQARDRIRNQMPSEEKAKLAQVVVDTDCDLVELKRRVEGLWHKQGLDRL